MQCPQCANELGRAQILCDSCGAVVSGLARSRPEVEPLGESLNAMPDPVDLQPRFATQADAVASTPRPEPLASSDAPMPVSLGEPMVHATQEPLPFIGAPPAQRASAFPSALGGLGVGLGGGLIVNASGAPPALNTLHWLSRPAEQPAEPAMPDVAEPLPEPSDGSPAEPAPLPAQSELPDETSEMLQAVSSPPSPSPQRIPDTLDRLFPPASPSAPAARPLPAKDMTDETSPRDPASNNPAPRLQRFRSLPALLILTVMVLPAPLALFLAWTSHWPTARKILFSVFNVGFVAATLAGAAMGIFLMLMGP